MFRMTTNSDVCDFLRSYVAFLPHESQEIDRQYKCYRMQYFACTLQYKFQYSYITAAAYSNP